MRTMKIVLALAGALMTAVPAAAQTPNTTGNTFQTGQAGKTVQGVVGMCPNASGVAVPCGSGGATLPAAATPIAGNGSGTTGAVVATLAAAAGKTTYLCDFDVSAIGGTASVGPITVTGLVGGTKTYQMSSSAGGNLLVRSFNPCLPSSAQNTAIVITTTADASATAVNVNSDGFQQ